MRVERFLADDMRQAMKKVRENLGSDALILSNRRVNGQTEIIAAAEESSEQTVAVDRKADVLRSRSAGEQPGEVTRNPVHRPAARKAAKSSQPDSLMDIRQELSRLRNMFEGELSQLAWREMADRQPNKVAIQKRLEMAGLNTYVSKMIVDKVMPCKDLDQAWQNALKKAAQLIHIPRTSMMEEGGIVALLGSTGVGKTTAAAKIASQFAARYGTNEVALISADNLRIGGREQLLIYGSSLGITVQFVSSRDDIEKTLNSLSQKRLILIDTAGMGLRDLALSERLQDIRIANRQIHPCLVLSATTQESVVCETIKAFAAARPQSAIITHTDECGSLGPTLSSLIRYQLPLSMVSTGPRVPEDMQKPDCRFLLANLVKSYKQAVKERKPHGEIPLLRSAVNG